MTGAPLPPGADSVVPIEDVAESDGVVSVPSPVTPGAFVRRPRTTPAPETWSCRPGRCHRPGWPSSPPWASARSRSAGVRSSRSCRPATSSSPRATAAAGQIHDANGPSLAAAVIEAGGEPRLLERVGDDPEAIERTLGAAASSADLIVTSGGVSVGRHDHVRDGPGAAGHPRLLAHRGSARQAARRRRAGRHDGHRAARQSGERARHLRALRAAIHPGDARTPRRRAPAGTGHRDRSECRRTAAGEPSFESCSAGPTTATSRVRPAGSSPPSSDRWPMRMRSTSSPRVSTPRSRGSATRRSSSSRRHETDPSLRRRRAANGRRRVEAGDRASSRRGGDRADASRGARDARRRGRAEGRRVRHRSPRRHRCGEANGRAHPAVPPAAARPCRRRADSRRGRRHGHHPGRGRRDGSHRGRDGGAHRGIGRRAHPLRHGEGAPARHRDRIGAIAGEVRRPIG